MFRNLIPRLEDQVPPGRPRPAGLRLLGPPPAPSSRTRSRTSPRSSSASPRGSGPAVTRSTYSTTEHRSAFGLATRHPERVTAIVSQNGNAYLDGLSDGWNPIRRTGRNRHRRTGLRSKASSRPKRPGSSTSRRCGQDLGRTRELCARFSAAPPPRERESARPVPRLPSNVGCIPRSRSICACTARPCWRSGGKNDPFFLPAGAEAFRRDQPAAEIHFHDTGHFALETHAAAIAAAIREFLDRTLPRRDSRRDGPAGRARDRPVRSRLTVPRPPAAHGSPGSSSSSRARIGASTFAISSSVYLGTMCCGQFQSKPSTAKHQSLARPSRRIPGPTRRRQRSASSASVMARARAGA